MLERKLSQSRTISESRYTMSKDEKRLLLMACTIENKQKIIEGRWFDFKLSDYARIFKVSKHESSRDTTQAVEALQDRWIYVKKEEGEYEKVRWIDGIRRSTKYGTKGIRFTAEMIELLKETPDEYSYQLSEITGLNSPDHIRIYDWVYDAIRLNKTGEITLTLEEILQRMQLMNHKSYKQYGNFKRVVLAPAVKHIEEKTSMTLSFEEVKNGRKVVAICFKGELPDKFPVDTK